MYKDKEKQKRASKERMRRYRERRNAEQSEGVTDVTPEPKGVTGFDYLPALPDDTVIACNQDIGWPEILAMTRSQIDYVYECWKAVGDNMLLRLRRAAGYHVRMA